MASTIIGAKMTFEGELVSDDEVVVEGILKGKLSSELAVRIEPGAEVEADVRGASLVVSGSLTGDVRADERVDLQHGSRVVGNLKAGRITIAEGAQFKGNVDMDV